MNPETNKLHRYPGVRPFKKEEKDIFFGRSTEAKKLYNLIMLEKMVVLFAKSGRGKSSLINAALTPLLMDNKNANCNHYIPIDIRLSNVHGDEKTPLEQVYTKLQELLPLPEQEFFIDKLIIDQAIEESPSIYLYKLWPYLKKIQLSQKKSVLLIFDQFEEFFRRTQREQEIFRWELSELIYTQVPQFIRDKIDSLSYEEYEQFSTNIDVKILFSIRSDRLSEMHSMNDALPDILKNRFEIESLDIKSATEAIVRPALIENRVFATHPFTYDNEALQTILKELSNKEEDYNSQNIETFHLQIICQACEAKIEEKITAGEIDLQINVVDLPGFADLYGDYYKRQIEKLPKNLWSVAENLLEEELIYGGHDTGGYRRLSVDRNILLESLSQKNATADLLEMLEDVFLIRREPNTVGGYSYEIAHDTIVEPIIHKKELKEKIASQKRMSDLIVASKKIKSERTFGRITLSILVACLLGILLYFNWETLFFSYYTKTHDGKKPVVKEMGILNNVNAGLNEEILNGARQINKLSVINSWEASQLMLALYGSQPEDNTFPREIKSQYLSLTNNTLRSESCCWREISTIPLDDIRISAWIMSASGALALVNKYKCDPLNFLLQNQLNTGGWPMVKIDEPAQDYSSTYATCHVIRALHNSLPHVNDSKKEQINIAIDKGIKWLMKVATDTTRMIWPDFAADENYENTISKSLSGLVVHTLNLTGNATPEMNRRWLKNLNMKDALLDITFREKSEKNIVNKKGEIVFRDGTRHLSLPWQIIATVDAYKDGNFSEKYHANKWLNRVVNNLIVEDVIKIPRFVKAELSMAFRYLGEENYTLK